MSYDRRYDQHASYYPQHQEHGGRGSYGERPPSNSSFQGGPYQPLSAYHHYASQNILPNPNASSNTLENERNMSGNRTAHQSAQDARSEYTRGHIPVNSINHGHPAHAPVTELNNDRYPPNSAARMSHPQPRNDPEQHVWRENNQTASRPLPRYMTDRYTSNTATTSYQQAEMTHGGQSGHSGSTFPISQTSHQLQERNHLPRPEYQQMRSTNGEDLQQAHPKETYRNMPLTANSSTSVQNGQTLSSSENSGNYRYNGLPQAQMPPPNMPQSSSEGPLSKAPRYPSEPTPAPIVTAPASQQTHRDHQPARQLPDSSHVTTSSQSQISMARPSSLPDVRTSNRILSGPSAEAISRPTTVDPRNISNHQEYQRRHAEVEKKRAADAMDMANRHQSPQLSNQPRDHAVQLSSKAGAESSSDSTSGMKDQMELEMKQMLDRMREYKAKDPAMFSHIWEQIRKGQPSQAMSSQAQALASSASPTVHQQNFPSPPVQASPERAEAEPQTSFPPGFDRGRFPYQRRRRGGRVSVAASRQDKPSGEQTGTAGQIQPPPVNGQSQAGPSPQMTPAPIHRDSPHERIVVTTKESRENPHNETGANLPAARRIPANKERDMTDERLVAAMREFNKSLGTQERAVDAAPFPPPAQTLPPRPLGPPGSSVTAGQVRVPSAPARPQSDIQTSSAGSQSKIGSTLWPEHKKEALAATAAYILNAHYGKDGRTISPVSVRLLLDQDLSYTQLCEALENRGFALDRWFFARALISAVPDLNQPSPLNPSRPDDRSRSATEAPPGPPSQDPRSPDRPSGNVQGSMKPPPPEPASKHEKARKRNFSEIIDLSQDRSDDDDARYRSVPQQYPASVVPLKTSSGPVPEAGGKAIAIRPSRRDHVRVEVVVQPLDKRRDAFRRSSYDPRTICRDLLISCGKHPTEAPLNAHLSILQERFDSVNDESDLKTLRWDILDPEGENAEEPEPDDAEMSRPDLREENTAPELSFVKEEAAAAAATAAREGPTLVNSSSKRPPPFTVQISPNPTPSGKSKPPRNPGANSENSTPPTVNHREPESKPLATSLDKAAFIRSYSFIPAATSTVPATTPNPPSSSGVSSPYATAESVRVPRRGGRPPGAKNKKPRPDKGIPRKRPMQFEPTDRSSRSESTTPRGSAAKEEKKVARPRDHASSPSAGISIVLPTRSPSVAHSQSNFLHRPAKVPPVLDQHDSPGVSIGAAPSSTSAGPRFEAHKCRWEGCPAELHNLETLWKHIRKHRTRLEKPYTCKWVGCRVGGGGGGEGRFRTPDMEAWDRHMETEHLRSFVRTG